MRFLLVTCLALFPAATLAANPDCAVFGEIVDKIVAERKAGKAANDTMEAVARGYSGNKQRFQPTIPLLAEWVYTLPQDQLGADVGKVYEAACQKQ